MRLYSSPRNLHPSQVVSVFALSDLSGLGGCRNAPGGRLIRIGISVNLAVGAPWWTLGRGHCGTAPRSGGRWARVLDLQRGRYSPCKKSVDLRLANRLLQIATDDP